MAAPAATVLIHEPPANSAKASVLALINSTVGAGVLSFPYAFRQTGWAAGLVCTFGIAAVEAFTMYVLARFAARTKCRTYSTLVGEMLGPSASLAMCLVMFLYPFGSCIAYLVIVGDSFQPLFLAAFGTTWWTSRSAIITGIGCMCILPLCYPTRLGALRAVSSLCVYGLMSVVGIIAFRSSQIVAGPEYSWKPVKAFNPSLQFLTALPLIVFAFHCHTNIVSIWDELEDQPALLFRPTPQSASISPSGSQPSLGEAHRKQHGQHWCPYQSRSAKLAGMVHVIAAGVGITAVFYSCVAIAGYLAFPDTAYSNITLNFSKDDWLMQAARACVGLIQICAYPVNHHPARGAVRDLIHQPTGSSVGGRAFHLLEPLAFFSTTLGLALWCNDLGVILKLVGGTCGSVLIFLMPGALLMQYCLSKQRACQQQQEEQQHPLQEPLLAGMDAAAEARSSSAALPSDVPQVLPESYSLLRMKLFWSGLVLLATFAFVTLLAIVTTLHPLG